MGCDSIVNSDLRVHTDTNYQLIYEPCYGDTLLFSGQKYDSDGTHVDSFQSIWGCDSVVNRKIVFKEKIDTVINVTLCKNATYPYLGKDYNAPGDIYDTLQAWNQCDSFLHVQLELTTLKSDFDIDSSRVPLVTFINHSDEEVKFIWHFGDGNTDSTDENPEHRYSNEEDREIEVCLEVEDSLGCRDTLCKNIKIYKLGYWLYNVFTPNEDGYNDIHRIGHRGETFTYDIYIYNRWGGLVYQSEQTEIDDATKFWNGQVMNTGTACPSGTYFVLYQFYTKGTDADPETVEGVVELLR
jgi:gliding motility-associated-like protein